LLPPAVGEPSTAEPPPRVTPAREATQPAESSPTGRGVNSDKTGQEAPEPVADRVALPEMPTKQLTPKVSSSSATEETPSLVESFGRTTRSLLFWATSALIGLFPQDDRLLERKLLGLWIILLTLVVCALMAWKLPMRRQVGDPAAWGIPTGHVGYYAYPAEPADHFEGTPGLALASPIAEPDPGSFGGKAPALEKNDLENAGMHVVARKRRERVLRERSFASRPVPPQGGLATGAHTPQVSRRLRRARNSARRSVRRGTTMTGAKKKAPVRPGPSLVRRREDAEPATKRALLVVKHALFREALATVLEWREGVKVAQAGSLAEARRLLRAPGAQPDFVVVDLALPDGDGFELIEEIREVWLQVPVLALSTGWTPERASWAKGPGASEVLTTAASGEDLLERLRRLGSG
jgi:CheY-like chemotaxis protein